MAVTTETFGTLKDGREAHLFTISTSAGSSVTLTDFGAAVVKVIVPDGLGRLGDVVLGFDSLDLYEQELGNFGAVCGRFANRLSRASLPLDRRVYPLTRNDGPNTLHGGAVGFHHKLWDAETVGEDGVRFTLFSPDGEEGFPGDLTVAVTYRFSEENVLSLDYEAAAGERNTVANLTNHTYWNLDGDTFGSILDHSVRIHASRFTPTNEYNVPDGRVLPVKGVFDLRAYRSDRQEQRLRPQLPHRRLRRQEPGEGRGPEGDRFGPADGGLDHPSRHSALRRQPFLRLPRQGRHALQQGRGPGARDPVLP